MRVNLNTMCDKNYSIIGTSYVGAPRSNTAMFITKKIKHFLHLLADVDGCLVFIELGIQIPQELLDKHVFIFSNKPNLDYARFVTQFEEKRASEEQRLGFELMPQGYWKSADVCIPDDAYIEPGCVIGPDVQLGSNSKILAGTVIKHTTIGDYFLSNQYAVIGANGFTIAEDEKGNKIRIPTLGRVVIGKHVEVGANDNISCGSAGDTVIDDYVKIDALVHIGHDAHIHKNVEITAGAIIGGFDSLREKAYVGINAVLRNRIEIGNNAIVGMGATVTKSVEADVTVVGNPARPLEKSSDLITRGGEQI